MPGPIYIRLSRIVVGRWVIVLCQEKFKILKVRLFILGNFFFSALVPEPYLISACMMTLSALRTVALRHIYLIIA